MWDFYDHDQSFMQWEMLQRIKIEKGGVAKSHWPNITHNFIFILYYIIELKNLFLTLLKEIF